MQNFVTFRWKESGVVEDLPAHYATHPVFGDLIEPYFEGEYEEDKVVVAGHELPVDQRGKVVATRNYSEMTNDELREALKEHELSTSGNKDELIERLVEADKNEVN